MSDVGRILEETSFQTSVTGSGAHVVAGYESYRAVTIMCDQCSLDSRWCPGGSRHTGDHFLEHSGATQSSDVLAWVYNPSIWESEGYKTVLSIKAKTAIHTPAITALRGGSKWITMSRLASDMLFEASLAYMKPCLVQQ